MIDQILSSLPNQLSLLRILLSPLFLICLVSDDPVTRQLSLLIFFIAAITDWYDGEIARRRGTITSVGKFLDPLADKILTSAAFIAFASLNLMPVWMVAVIVVRDIAITLLRSMAENRNQPIITTKLAQTKTFIQMSALYYVLLLYIAKDIGWVRRYSGDLAVLLLHPTILYILMLIVTLLTIYTGAQYLLDNRKIIHALVKTERRP